MFGKLKALLSSDEIAGATNGAEDDGLAFAAAALLMEAARQDGQVDPEELAPMQMHLAHHFGLDDGEAKALVNRVADHTETAVEFSAHTRAIKEGFDAEERIALVEWLWEVVYADGEVTDFEANLLRRIAGLIYVSDRDRGEARKRVVARLAGPNT